VPLYLTDTDVEGLLRPDEAAAAVEACCRRLAAGTVESLPRRRLQLPDGSLAVMAATDRELGLAGVKTTRSSTGAWRPSCRCSS
jgi:ornithine cyclodeaminase/alanine dehydrogenase-like protein (mu-crystallin family)